MTNFLNRTFQFLSANARAVPAPAPLADSPHAPYDPRGTEQLLRLDVIASLTILISGCVTSFVYIEPPE